MKSNNILRSFIRNVISENFIMNETPTELDEERLTTEEGKEYVKNRKNFIGSHIWGEKVGDSYVAVSYGEHFPIYIYDKGKWYENGDDYIFNGEKQKHTDTHKQDLRPTHDTHLKSKAQMIELLNLIKKENNISSLDHTSVVPGEKN